MVELLNVLVTLIDHSESIWKSDEASILRSLLSFIVPVNVCIVLLCAPGIDAYFLCQCKLILSLWLIK